MKQTMGYVLPCCFLEEQYSIEDYYGMCTILETSLIMVPEKRMENRTAYLAFSTVIIHATALKQSASSNRRCKTSHLTGSERFFSPMHFRPDTNIVLILGIFPSFGFIHIPLYNPVFCYPLEILTHLLSWSLI